MHHSPDRRFYVTRFLLGFGFLYGLLMWPWPGLNQLYSRYFCALGEWVFARPNQARVLHFSSETNDSMVALDTRITLANRAMLDRNGTGRALVLATSSRAIGWVPTAMTIALIWATPLSWRRRAKAGVWGLLGVHALILISLAVYIWNNSDGSSGLRLVEFAPLTKRILTGLEEMLITQQGMSFSAPIVIWLLVILRTPEMRAWATNRILIRPSRAIFSGEAGVTR